MCTQAVSIKTKTQPDRGWEKMSLQFSAMFFVIARKWRPPVRKCGTSPEPVRKQSSSNPLIHEGWGGEWHALLKDCSTTYVYYLSPLIAALHMYIIYTTRTEVRNQSGTSTEMIRKAVDFEVRPPSRRSQQF